MIFEREVRNELERFDKVRVGDALFARVVGEEVGVVGIHRRLDLVVRDAVHIVVGRAVAVFIRHEGAQQRAELRPRHGIFGIEIGRVDLLGVQPVFFDLRIEQRLVVDEREGPQVFGQAVERCALALAERRGIGIVIVFVDRLRPEFGEFVLRDVGGDVLQGPRRDPFQEIVIRHIEQCRKISRGCAQRRHIVGGTDAAVGNGNVFVPLLRHELVDERLIVLLFGKIHPSPEGDGDLLFDRVFGIDDDVVTVISRTSREPRRRHDPRNGNCKPTLLHFFLLTRFDRFFYFSPIRTELPPSACSTIL